MVLQISRVSCTQGALRRGTTTHPPTVCLGLQSAQLQFNQRSYRCIVESIRGVKACARGVPYPHASEWVSRSIAQSDRCGRPDHCASAGAQGRQLQTFPRSVRRSGERRASTSPSTTPVLVRGSDELNFGYHVSEWHSHEPRSSFPPETPSELHAPRASDFSRLTCTH
jgi:hypothetical protein